MDFEIKFIRNPGLRDDERDYLFFLEGLESGFDPHVFTECTVLLEARWDEFRVDSWAYGLRFLNGVTAFFCCTQ